MISEFIANPGYGSFANPNVTSHIIGEHTKLDPGKSSIKRSMKILAKGDGRWSAAAEHGGHVYWMRCVVSLLWPKAGAGYWGGRTGKDDTSSGACGWWISANMSF